MQKSRIHHYEMNCRQLTRNMKWTRATLGAVWTHRLTFSSSLCFYFNQISSLKRSHWLGRKLRPQGVKWLCPASQSKTLTQDRDGAQMFGKAKPFWPCAGGGPIVHSADPSQGHQGCPLQVKLPVYLPARQHTPLGERFRGFPDTQSP